MALITILSRIENGANRSLDISSNTLVTLSIKVGGGVSNTELTKTILDGLIAHAASTSNPHSVTKAQVGLSAVDNVQQLPMSYLDTDVALTANSDTKVASQKAVKAYVDGHAGAAASALDGTFVIKNTADNTKQIAFDASAITTGTIRSLKMADANVDLAALTNSNISASAAIAESKLALSFSTSSLNTAIGGKAATDLSNLAATAVNASILPATTDTIDLGAANKRWNKGFIAGLYDGAGVMRWSPGSAYDATGLPSIAIAGRQLKDSVNVLSLDWDFRQLKDSANGISANWESRILSDINGVDSINWDARLLLNSVGTTTMIDFSTAGAVNVSGNKITGLAAPTANGDALRFDQLGANSGIATLDAGGKVPVSQLPNSVMTFEGIWDASTNTPTLADATGNAGMVYLVTVAGTQNLGSGSQTFAIGDWVVANSSVIWQKSINSNAVVSVNGSTGVVTVNAINQLTGDITAGPASGSASAAATIAAGAVTLSKMASASVDENKIVSTTMSATGAITGGSGTKLAVAVDASTIEIATNALQVKDLGISTAKLAATSVTAAKLGSDVAGSGLTGGNGSALDVAFAPKLASTEVSINAISGVKALRYAVAADAGFVAGQMVVADNDATSADNFYVMGISSGSVSAGGNATLVRKGVVAATAHGFTVGLPVFLGASGALTQTAPTAALSAVVRVAIARDANNLDVDIQLIGVN
jgi:hypothetical protein